MGERPLLWVGASLAAVRGFPDDVRRLAGHQLHRIQLGLDPDDWKPMSAVGPGVREIRLSGYQAHRILYVASFPEGIYVLHAFEKKSARTRHADLDLAKARLRAVVRERRRAP